VRAFSSDLVKYKCTTLQYIGELCRYLVNAPPSAEDAKVRIDCAIGNGMRPDIWDKFQVRLCCARCAFSVACSRFSCVFEVAAW
jgi:acyl-CoA synthetase (AMP-forming)/AMP-acid ligase II